MSTACDLHVLTVDVGNTTTRLGMFSVTPDEAPCLLDACELTTKAPLTADEARVELGHALELLPSARIAGAILSCVVPTLGAAWRQALERTLGCRVLVVGPGLKSGIKLLFDNPAEGAAVSSAMLPRIMRQSRNVLFCGDSYGVEYDSVDQFYGIGHYLQNVYGTAWNVTNVSVAGTGFVSANGSNTFPTMINTSAATGIDTVIIAGGINDLSQTETGIYNGAVSCINNAHTKWPGCEVFIIPMLYTWLLPTINLRKVVWSVKRACMDAGATCIEGAWSWGLGHQSDWYIGPSSVHPNSTGAEAMARRIHNCVENNQVDAFNTINGASNYINVFYDHDNIRLTGVINYGAKAQMPDYFQIGNPFNGNAGTATPNIITFGFGMNTMGHTGVLIYNASTRQLSMGGDVSTGENCYFDCVTNPWIWQFA